MQPDLEVPAASLGLAAENAAYTGPGYDLGMTHYQCVTDLSQDADSDGLDDTCENALALAFQPRLRVFQDEDPSREPVYAVRRTGSTVVRIAYLLAYHQDKGGPIGLAPDWALWLGHAGDSEFVIIDVVEQGGVWLLQSAFLSAHYQANTVVTSLLNLNIDRSGWRNYGSLSYADNYRGRPKIWTAWGKHANYASMADCEAHPFDVCSRPGQEYWSDALVFAGLQRNIGHGTAPLMDCIPSQNPSYYGGQECFWNVNQSSFKGWYSSGWGKLPGPYRNTLSHFGFQATPPGPVPSVSIRGPLEVHSQSNCYWNANVTGGTAPYTYQWYKGTTLVGTGLGWGANTGTQDFFLTLIVRDTYGQSGDATIIVDVGTSYPSCLERVGK